MRHISRFLIFAAVAVLSGRVAYAQDQGTAPIKKLAFLAGSWTCAIQGPGIPNGAVDDLSYEFAPDWSWMLERSNSGVSGRKYWSAQLWGYDAQQKKVVAYQFTPAGVFTKSVDGWVGDEFVSKRDDNGATVSVKPVGPRAFNWVIESADHSTVVTEACTR